MDRFAAKVNIEVQWASEQTIAAVERNGGVITTAYFDIFCVNALSDPKRYFSLGHPVCTLVCRHRSNRIFLYHGQGKAT